MRLGFYAHPAAVCFAGPGAFRTSLHPVSASSFFWADFFPSPVKSTLLNPSGYCSML